MGGFNLQDLMSKAKAQYESLQRKMQETVVEASSGGGAITVIMTGDQRVQSISLAPEVVDPEDVEMLEDLVLTGVKQAIEKGKAMAGSEMGKMTAGLGLPP